jgi:hypothetical protein
MELSSLAWYSISVFLSAAHRSLSALLEPRTNVSDAAPCLRLKSLCQFEYELPLLQYVFPIWHAYACEHMGRSVPSLAVSKGFS